MPRLITALVLVLAIVPPAAAQQDPPGAKDRTEDGRGQNRRVALVKQ